MLTITEFHLWIVDAIELFLIVLTIWAGKDEILAKLGDIFDWSETYYKVLSTTQKDLMRDEGVETTKLRRIRARKRIKEISVDKIPEIYSEATPGERVYRECRLSSHYSMPGRTHIDDAERTFVISFADDERLQKRQNHSVFLTYTIAEPLDAIQADPPSTSFSQPIGNDFLCYELHVQGQKTYATLPNGQPKLRIYVTDSNHTVRTLHSGKDYKAYSCRPHNHKHEDGHGSSEWFRVTIPNPPQDGAITIQWEWRPRPPPSTLYAPANTLNQNTAPKP